jgi:hypothetical protein
MTCDEIQILPIVRERKEKLQVLSVDKIWSWSSVRFLHEYDRTLSDCQL